ADEFTHPIVKEIYLEYEKEKKSSHCLDFDDLILYVLNSFQTNEEYKLQHQQKIRNILVDEYQDTNKAQHELLKNMALNSKNKFTIDTICAVGDEDQSIYSWRGAVVTNMINFQNDFKPVTLIKIEQNYRSVENILKAANNVIENNKIRHPKNLWSNKKAKNRILALNCKSDFQESDVITTIIKNFPREKKLNEVAIIYRTHFQSRILEESFIKNSIAYNIVGGVRFYERKEIKDLLAYLRLIINPHDKTSLIRIINTPARGLGSKFEEELFFEWNNNNLLDFRQILEYLKTMQPDAKAQAINDFLNIFSGLKKEFKTSFVINKILQKTNYISFLKKSCDIEEYNSRSQNIEELLRSIDFFESNKNKLNPNDPFYEENVDKDLETFLHEVALLQDKISKQNIEQENQDERGQVQMMTMHAAKGLEFDTVIICGLEEGILPSSKSLNTEQELEEERRLFYVGITRAKERLILTHANYRNSYGQIVDQVESRFLAEIPSRLFEYLDVTQAHPLQIQSEITRWLGIKTIQSKLLTFQPSKKENLFFQKQKTKLINESTPWRKNQAVIHKKFGAGLVTNVEKKDDEKYYLTVLFKTGQKKVLSTFVKRI
ncbi:MAG: 3'-5' exonuclease, partial [bacterium]